MKHLMFDLFEKTDGVTLEVNPPKKIGYLGSHGPFGTVINNRIWTGSGSELFQGSLVANEGASWYVKPWKVGINMGYEGTVFWDPQTARYVYLYNVPEIGMFFAFSTGDYWRRDNKPVMRHGCDSNNTAFFDEATGKYKFYLRAWDFEYPGKRKIVLAEVDDIYDLRKFDEDRGPKNLPEMDLWPLTNQLPTVMTADGEGEEHCDLYTSSVVKYGDWYLAFPSLYSHFPVEQDDKWDESIHEGLIEIQFAYSRDGITWTRMPEPYIGSGMEDDPDSGCLYMYTGMRRIGDRIYQYYYADNMTHGKKTAFTNLDAHKRSGLYVAEQTLDRFACLRLRECAVVKLKPLRVSGKRLIVNADISASGYLNVGIDGRSIQAVRRQMDDCGPLRGNQTRHIVKWKWSSDLSDIAESDVWIWLRGRNAKVYSLAFE